MLTEESNAMEVPEEELDERRNSNQFNLAQLASLSQQAPSHYVIVSHDGTPT